MAYVETDVIIYGKQNGNLSFIFPATKKDNIIDLEDATETESGLMSVEQVKTLNKMQQDYEDAIFIDDEEEEEVLPDVTLRDADTLGGRYTAADIEALIARITALENR